MKEVKKNVAFQVCIPNMEGDGVQEIVNIQVPVVIDGATGEELLTEEAVSMIDTTKARYMGLLLPEEIKALRKKHGLTQKEMSEVLQAGEKSYTRWESGRARPSRMVNLLLRLLHDGKLSVQEIIGAGQVRRDQPGKLKKAPGAHRKQERMVLARN